MKFSRITAMLKKEFLLILRDPRMIAVILFVPVFQSLVFGYAVNTDVRNIKISFTDYDQTSDSREFISFIDGSGYFETVSSSTSFDQAENLLINGKIRMICVISSGFSKNLRSGKNAIVQALFDGSDSSTSSVMMGYFLKMLVFFNNSGNGSVSLQERVWFNQEQKSRNFFIPGVVALLLMIVSMLLSSMSIVREKETGTIEQIMVTPIRKLEFIMGKTIPFALTGYLELILIFLIARFWFEIPYRGNLSLLFSATFLYLMCSTGIGLLISTVSDTQQQAMMSAFLFIFPAMLLSGFVFPVSGMPEEIRLLTYLNPLKHYLVVIRTLFFKGCGINFLYQEFIWLTFLGFSTLIFAVMRFNKTTQ